MTVVPDEGSGGTEAAGEKKACLFLRLRFEQLTCVHGKAEPEDLPSACDTCNYYAGHTRGLGDVVADAVQQHLPNIARAFKNCKGCGRRRKKLNDLRPAKDPDASDL